MTKQVIIYTDPGHGWAKVKRAELKELGIEDKISPYSYQKGKTVYLEEDCDFSVYVSALKKLNVVLSFIEKHTDRRHPIRSYDCFKPEVGGV
jgi:hypothetical protein